MLTSLNRDMPRWRCLTVIINMKNVLITSAGKRVVLVQIFQHTLQEMGLEAKVYTTDMRPSMAPAGIISDECIPVPRCTADNYIDSLLDICSEKLRSSTNNANFSNCARSGSHPPRLILTVAAKRMVPTPLP